MVGKTEESFVKEAFLIYSKRLAHYVTFSPLVIPEVKNASKLSEKDLKVKEGELLLKQVHANDFVVLLDAKGKQYSSLEYAGYMQKIMNSGVKNLIFIIGGAFGFSEQVYLRSNAHVSLSKMTLTHQMVRIFFVEQTYRAMTILKGEAYHHE
jgi:23S rRNA (pseudouridine1915-N3)-methyltransferase